MNEDWKDYIGKYAQQILKDKYEYADEYGTIEWGKLNDKYYDAIKQLEEVAEKAREKYEENKTMEIYTKWNNDELILEFYDHDKDQQWVMVADAEDVLKRLLQEDRSFYKA